MSRDRHRQLSAEDVAMLAFETLEQRAYFSAPYDFAAVGIRFDAVGGPQAYIAEGTIGIDDSITGTMQFATLAGAGSQQPIDWTSYNRAPHAAFSFGTRAGFTAYDSQSGTQFIAEERFTLGTFVGRGANGAPRDHAVLSERALDGYTFNDFRSALGDGLQLQMMRLITQGQVEIVTVDVSLNLNIPFGQPIEMTLTYHLPSGDVSAVRHSTNYADGKLTLDGGEVLMLSGFRDGAFLSDLDAADGIVGVASGRVRIGGDRQNGRFRGEVVVSGPFSAAFFGLDPSAIGPSGTGVADVVVELNLNSLFDPDGVFNTFAIYRRGEYDAGTRIPVITGLWRSYQEPSEPHQIISQRIDLIADDGTVVSLRTGAAHYLSFDHLNSPLDGHEELFGSVAGASLAGNQLVEYHADVDASGRPIAFVQLSTLQDILNPSPYSIDLVNEVGGSPVVGKLTTWSDYQRAQFWAGVSATGEVQVWRFGIDYGWTYTNLTAQLTGARPIVGDLYFSEYNTAGLATDTTRNQFLSGFDVDGKFVVYRQIHGELLDANSVWDFVDAEGDGFGSGATRPQFTTGLSGWGSSWGAAHFAGLDANGHVWSLWWAPTLDKWEVSDITAGSGTPVLVGELSVVRTPWSTFHINGTDANGNLVVTWWAPGFESWHVNNLTEELGGPTLAPDSLTSNYHIGLRTMNIVGQDSNGQARSYWWTPDGGWNIHALSGGL
ncbi:MAG: hypothetical protein H7210_01900, partial [Pyrinomonadaceae bacterium]|nr:hypothetical protein [Phycisphaerales bacterium]